MKKTVLQLGLKVKALRESKNLTQKDLAETLGVSWRTISNLERGTVMPKLQLVCDLAKHFDISIDELLNRRITKNKSVTRIKKENQVVEAIYRLDDKLLANLEDYIQFLKKNFE